MSSHPVWAEVDLSAIKHNMQEIKKLVAYHVNIMAVVKANAYGHGLVEVAKTLVNEKVAYLAVARLDEAIKLRKSSIKIPVMVMGYTNPSRYVELIDNDITQTIYNLQLAVNLNNVAKMLGKKAKIHIEIDTGMGRLGFVPSQHSLEQISQITKLSNLECEGIYTHFADADNSDNTYTVRQLELFFDLLNELLKRGVDFKFKHAANSAAVINYPQSHLNMIRPGIMIYGIYPSEEMSKCYVNLKPAMTLKAVVSNVKTVNAGTCIGYGCTYCANKKTLIATIPIGYGDGYTRRLTQSAKAAEVLIHGVRAPVVGSICMDQCMIDVTHIDNVSIGDEVVIFGKQEREEITVDEIARNAGTISYEVVSTLAARVPRIYN